MWTLARKILLHDRIKFAVAAAGVSVSVVLIMVQIGLYLGFMDNASCLIDHAQADIWVGPKGGENFDFSSPMDDRIYYRVAEMPGVERAERMLMGFAQFKLPSGGDQGVQIVGLQRDARLAKPWNVIAGDWARAAEADGIVVDKSEFGKLHVDGLGDRREVNQIQAQVVGLTDGIRSFTASPFVFTNLDSARTYSRTDPHAITYVLVKVAPGVDVERLAARLAELPNVDAYTKAAFSARTRAYWSSRTGVGVALFATAMLGIVVGLVVVGQILYNSTLEHLKEYGTLKAMGATNATIVRVIGYQALISAVVGFAVGALLSFGAQAAMHTVDMVVLLPVSLALATLALTVFMCGCASLLSILRVLSLDPATVFKG